MSKQSPDNVAGHGKSVQERLHHRRVHLGGHYRFVSDHNGSDKAVTAPYE